MTKRKPSPLTRKVETRFLPEPFTPLPQGTNVVIDSPGHRLNGYLGTINYYSTTWGTYGVGFGGMGEYGFAPSEIKPTGESNEPAPA